MKQELINLIDTLNEVNEETQLGVRSEIIFQEAIRIYITNSINNSKKSYPSKSYPKSSYKNSSYTSKDKEPTEKQIYALKQAGKEIPAGLTRDEATAIIKELKK